MIAVIKYGKGFKGVLQYAMGKPGAYLIGDVRGAPDELAAEFGMIRSRNPRIQKPVLHLALAIHPEEMLDDQQWERIAREVMERLGYDDNRYVVIRHTDERRAHIHVAACRIRNTDAQVVKNYREMHRTERILRDIERRYGLRRVPMSADVGRKAATHAERNMSARTRQRLIKHIFQERIEAARAGRPTLTTFLQKCAALGVDAKINIGGDRITGISYEIGGVRRKGSQLGKAYSWGGILKTVDYDPARDLVFAKQHAQGNKPVASSDRDEELLEDLLLTEKELKTKSNPKSKLEPEQPPPSSLKALAAFTRAVRRIDRARSDQSAEDEDQDREDRKRDRSR